MNELIVIQEDGRRPLDQEIFVGPRGSGLLEVPYSRDGSDDTVSLQGDHVGDFVSHAGERVLLSEAEPPRNVEQNEIEQITRIGRSMKVEKD
jgi:hypothetical protein